MMQIKIILTDQATMTITRILRRGTTAAKTINKNVLKRQKANNGFVFNTNSYGNTKNTWSYFQSFQNSGRSNIRLQSKNLCLHEIEYMRNEKENRNSEDNNKKVGDEDEYASFKLLSGSLACLGLANLLRTSTKAESDNNKKSYECVNVLPEDPEQIEDDVLTNNEIQVISTPTHLYLFMKSHTYHYMIVLIGSQIYVLFFASLSSPPPCHGGGVLVAVVVMSD